MPPSSTNGALGYLGDLGVALETARRPEAFAVSAGMKRQLKELLLCRGEVAAIVGPSGQQRHVNDLVPQS